MHEPLNYRLRAAGVVCRLLSIPIWVLKQLDEEGIVSPPRMRAGQSRLYSKKELKKLHKIWYLMDERNVKVDGIKVILEVEAKRFFGQFERALALTEDIDPSKIEASSENGVLSVIVAKREEAKPKQIRVKVR